MEMSYPEGEKIEKENGIKEEIHKQINKKEMSSGTSGIALASFKNPKTWKKSISNFFKNESRSTKSNDGDCPTGSKENFKYKEISPEQKWQSLGKIFRRQSFVEHNMEKTPNEPIDESSSSKCVVAKRSVVKKALSHYFGKGQNNLPASKESEN